ncbi:MAG: phenylacetate--CoA ligase family protein [Chitinophagaceae bacterium]|nr:phenylacetate--CoA ligase family protein [Chitinophagaceae bacterium]
MGFKEKLYQSLPVFLQNAAISYFGYTWRKRRFGGIFQKELNACKERESYDADQWQHYLNNSLQSMLCFAYREVPFYQMKFQQAGFTENDLQAITQQDLHRIPFLEKNELRLFGETTLLAKTAEPGRQFYASSGSTGTPTKICFSTAMHQRWSAAFEARIRHWAGIDNRMARGMIGGRRVLPEGNARPPFYRYNLAEKQVYYSAYHISPANASNYVEAMYHYKLQYMTGYAVSNYLLALYIQQKQLKAPQMKAVVTSSEKLTPEMREVLEEVYQCKTYDSWSGVEACALVTECEAGSLHISEDVGIIEILDEHGNEVAEGETGEVVCTGLLNFDQPLIRYRIGDRMTKGKGRCKCGRSMPVIQEIEGRMEDVVTGPDGRQMVRFHGIFVGIPEIERAQVIQHQLDEIEIRIQHEKPIELQQQELIRQRMISQLGNVLVRISLYQKIEQTPNGKYKAVISHIK